MANQKALTRTLIDLADTLVDDFDVIDLLTLLVDRCVEVLDISAAGLLLATVDGHLQPAASSSEAIRVVELFELQSDEGPCQDCFRTGEPVVNQRLSEVSGRWPTFAPVATAAGFRSVHALPMRLRGTVIGALNLFDEAVGELSEADREAGQALADMATISILQNRATVEAQTLNWQLNHALTSRIVIEQAKGMLAERTGLEMDQAFSRLRSYARQNNLRLAVVAQAVLDDTLPSATLEPPE